MDYKTPEQYEEQEAILHDIAEKTNTGWSKQVVVFDSNGVGIEATFELDAAHENVRHVQARVTATGERAHVSDSDVLLAFLRSL